MYSDFDILQQNTKRHGVRYSSLTTEVQKYKIFIVFLHS